VQDKAPAEPQSFLDLGLSLFLDARKKVDRGRDIKDVKNQLAEGVKQIATVFRGVWVSRFDEIEYVASIWINWVVSYAEFKGLDIWPSDLPKCFKIPNFRLDLFVAMGWDTDKTDIDLHVHEPGGNQVYYGNKCGRLSKDFTQGYGPECYTNKAAKPGLYDIRANYYGSSQVSQATGTTSVVLWTVQNMGSFEEEILDFRTIRLDRNKSNLTVFKILLETSEL